MSNRTTIVRLKHPLFRGSLSLQRVPKFLRFTYTGAGIAACGRAWDALDQLDDEPRAGETLIVGRLAYRGSVHLDGVRNGRRCGWNEDTADYDLVDPQPPQDVLRDTARWRAWCDEQVAAEAGKVQA